MKLPDEVRELLEKVRELRGSQRTAMGDLRRIRYRRWETRGDRITGMRKSRGI
jgi:hypothetical protein